MASGLFLDRDGVINVNTHYPHLPEDLYFMPGVMDAFRLLLARPEITVCVISNQSGVGRGFFTKAEVLRFEGYMKRRIFEETGYYLPKAQWYHSWTEDPKDVMRKPRPGMINAAIKDHDLDPKESWLIGDKLTDLEAGNKAGISNVYLMKSQDRLDTLIANLDS